MTTTELPKTLVLLDFDGVVSPIRKDKFSFDKSFKVFRLGGFTCHVHEKVIEFLNTLKDANNVEVKWCTSWVDITESFHGETQGIIPNFPYLSISKGKHIAVQNELKVSTASTVIAVDDYTTVVSKYRKIKDSRLLVIKPDIETGLTTYQMNKILSLAGLPKLSK